MPREKPADSNKARVAKRATPSTAKPAAIRLRSATSRVHYADYIQSYTTVYIASREDRIAMIRQGVPASFAKKILKDFGIEQKAFYQALRLAAATVNRKAKHDDHLSSGESERVLGVAKLVGQLEAIVSESGDAQGFDAPAWISRWLREPLPAFGGDKPINFLDTMEGQSLVSEALARVQSGAYA